VPRWTAHRRDPCLTAGRALQLPSEVSPKPEPIRTLEMDVSPSGSVGTRICRDVFQKGSLAETSGQAFFPATRPKADARTRTGDPFITSEVLQSAKLPAPTAAEWRTNWGTSTKTPANWQLRKGLENRYPSLGGSRVRIPPPREGNAMNLRPQCRLLADGPCCGSRAAEGQQTLEIEPTQSCTNQVSEPAEPHQ
jgi:hypothetical protein